MKRIQNSTKTQPLLFFEQFLKKESLLSFEKEFYEMPINPSFKAYKDLGYIEYTKDSYKNREEDIPVKVIFNDALQKRLKIQYDLSLKYIKERKEEIENIEKNSNVYINRQIFKLDELKNSFECNDSYRSIIIELLDEIENYLLNFIEEEPSSNIDKRKIIIPGRTYFDLKKEFKPIHLKKLYEATSLLDIIDDDLVSKYEFITVLTLGKLPNNNYKITFKKDNRTVIYYLDLISVIFNDFTPRAISRSKSFIKKNGISVFNENEINKTNSFFRKKGVSKYEHIKKEIEKILPT